MKKRVSVEHKEQASSVSGYSIQAVKRACDILKCFEQGRSSLTLSDVVSETKLSRTVAFRNAEIFVRENVDLVIEFQTNQQSASIVASKLIEAEIPIIAIEIPHPGADYYGANNYRAGLLAGHALAQAAIHHWKGQVDEVMLLELAMAGRLPSSRLTGVLAGLRGVPPEGPDQ